MKKVAHSVPPAVKSDDVSHELIQAAEHGAEARVKALLKNPGCDAKFKLQNGETALMKAAAHGHAACAQLLMPLSDPWATNRSGVTVLMLAASAPRPDCVQMLIPVSNTWAQDVAGATALIWAALSGHADCVQLLLPVSAPLVQDHGGMTALMWAAVHGHIDCVQLLLPMSNIGATDQSKGLTAKERAQSRGYDDIVALIDTYALARREHADLHASTGSGATKKDCPRRI